MVFSTSSEIACFDIGGKPIEQDVSLLSTRASLRRELAPALGPSHQTPSPPQVFRSLVCHSQF